MDYLGTNMYTILYIVSLYQSPIEDTFSEMNSHNVCVLHGDYVGCMVVVSHICIGSFHKFC